jgi:hypothetical protein
MLPIFQETLRIQKRRSMHLMVMVTDNTGNNGNTGNVSNNGNNGNNVNTPTNPPTNNGGIGAVILKIINNPIPKDRNTNNGNSGANNNGNNGNNGSNNGYNGDNNGNNINNNGNNENNNGNNNNNGNTGGYNSGNPAQRPPPVSGFPSNPTSFAINGVGINAGPTAIVIGGQTITSVPPTPTTVVSSGQTLVLSSGHIISGSTTVLLEVMVLHLPQRGPSPLNRPHLLLMGFWLALGVPPLW